MAAGCRSTADNASNPKIRFIIFHPCHGYEQIPCQRYLRDRSRRHGGACCAHLPNLRSLTFSMLNWKRTVVALLLFGTAFGYLEAAVVSYLRLLHEPARQRFYPRRPPDELFPLLTLEQLHGSAEQPRTLAIEIGREAATIAMLATVALAVSGNAGQWAAAFVIAFGAWDIAFYVFLKLL